MSNSRERGLVSFYLLHGLNYLVPLVTVPLLTRLLGPTDYGRYGVFLVWTGFAAQVIDFGLGIGATKRISRGETLADAEPARTMLYQGLNALPTLAVLAFGAWWLPVLFPGGAGFVLGLLATLAIGLTPLWYYVARNRVGELMRSTLVARIACMVVVAGLLPVWPSIGIALLAYLLNVGWIFWVLWRVRAELAAQWRAFSWSAYRDAMRKSFAVTMQRMGAVLFLNVPAMLVAAWHGLAAAGLFVLVDRLVRISISLLQPIGQQLLPMQVAAQRTARGSAERAQVRRFVIANLGLAVVGSLILGFGADLVVRLVAGEEFAGAGHLLAILAGHVLIVNANRIVCNELIAHDMEPAIAKTIWACGIGFLLVVWAYGRDSLDVILWAYLLVELAVLVILLALVGLRARGHSAAVPANAGPRPTDASKESA